MTIYVDSSAYVKLFLDEDHADQTRVVLAADPGWVTARHTAVEVRRTLARALRGPELAEARSSFTSRWMATMVRELDLAVCEAAAEIAETEGIRTLDALHFAAARLPSGTLPVLTYDRRMAEAARRLGMTVIGA